MIKYIIFITLLITFTNGQTVFNAMLNDSQISLFAKYAYNNDEIKSYESNPYLTLFAPADSAFNQTGMRGDPKLFIGLMYKSLASASTKGIVGTTANWSSYLTIADRNGNNLRHVTAMNGRDLYLYNQSGSIYCNDAKIIKADNVFGSQTYHIIDRVLQFYESLDFMNFLIKESTLSKSLEYWNILNGFADRREIIYQKNFIEYSEGFAITILVPTNTAWESIKTEIPANFTDRENLFVAMGRYFIPSRLLFLNGQEIRFKVGFNQSPRLNDDGLFDGVFTSDMQVTTQGFNAKIVKANIPIKSGVVHLIDNPMVIRYSVIAYLRIYIIEFYILIQNMPSLSMYLNDNYTILAPSGPALKSLDNSTGPQALINSFVPGPTQLKPDATITTVGNLSIQMKSIRRRYFIRVLQSQVNNTWIRIIPIEFYNQMVGATYISKIGGLISGTPNTCSDTFIMMNSSIYQNLLVTLGINLSVGSPYTMLVPDDTTMTNFINSQSTIAKDNKMMRYLIQRMIIANEMILATKSSGTFKAATMNYAAMNEWLNMTLTSTNCTVQYNTTQATFNYTNGGYRCYSNSETDGSRFNLIYPVRFFLISPADSSLNICLSPPCTGCSMGLSTLLILIGLAIVWWAHDGGRVL